MIKESARAEETRGSAVVKIELSDERKSQMVTAIQAYFTEHLDHELGELGAGVDVRCWGAGRGAGEAGDRAAVLDTGNLAVQLALGRNAARLGDREAAFRHLDRALEIRPDSRAALRERAEF